MTDRDISVVLVDEFDEVIGFADKLEVHRKGLLHRAFSILIYNEAQELLIQRRSGHKYHAAGLWANSCCGHPFPGESAHDAASRRLFEELGLRCNLQPLTHIYYKKDLDHGMIEHEYVHVFQGYYNAEPILSDPHEVSEITWISIDDLKKDVAKNPEEYAAWFSHYVENYADDLFAHLEKKA